MKQKIKKTKTTQEKLCASAKAQIKNAIFKTKSCVLQ